MLSLAFSPDGSILASGGADGIIILWDPASGAQIQQLEGDMQSINSVAFSPNGSLLAAGCSNENNLRLWDVNTASEVLRLRAHTTSITGVAFSPDGKILASGAAGGDIRLWAVP